jgi:uncharacterized membrane protein
MPEISPLGWFHTIIGIIALVTGVTSLIKYKVIKLEHRTSQIFLVCTLIAAVTALMIFARGAFGPAHALAILTLLALALGMVAAKTKLFGKLSPYVQAMSFSGTFLFHMIPAITDGLMRLPVGNPIVTDFTDPFLHSFYLAFLITYGVGFGWQVMWLRRQD